jgi:hypothetical protein
MKQKQRSDSLSMYHKVVKERRAIFSPATGVPKT